MVAVLAAVHVLSHEAPRGCETFFALAGTVYDCGK
jgi:hypothetical protein